MDGTGLQSTAFTCASRLSGPSTFATFCYMNILGFPNEPSLFSGGFCTTCVSHCVCPRCIDLDRLTVQMAWQASLIGASQCVCVCHLIYIGVYDFHAGGTRPSRKRVPTKLCVMVEARSDQPGVPAISTVDHAVPLSVCFHGGFSCYFPLKRVSLSRFQLPRSANK